MGMGYAGTILGMVTCPHCNKENEQPQATTDGNRLYAVCKFCGAMFLVQ